MGEKLRAGVAVWIIASCAFAQTPPGPQRIQEKKSQQSPALVTPSPATTPAATDTQPAPDSLEPAVAPAPEPPPTHPPVITWDGKLLTVDADNSTLTDILVAVREKTGASMEFPPSVASERVALRIGPAPVRDVLSALLYGTNFDYIIETDDNNADVLKNLVVTARGIMSDDAVAASATVAAGSAGAKSGGTSAAGSHNGVRMMRGWAAPGKPNSQAEGEAALAAQQAAEEEAAANKEAPASAEAGTGAPDGASAGADSSAASKGTADPSAPPASADASSGTPAPDAAASGSTLASSDSNSNDPTGVTRMMDDMTKMFQQRQKLQAQQNQAISAPPATPSN